MQHPEMLAQSSVLSARIPLRPQMTDSPRNLSDLPKAPGTEAFTRLLSALSPNSDEACLRYNSLHAKLVNFVSPRKLNTKVDLRVRPYRLLSSLTASKRS